MMKQLTLLSALLALLLGLGVAQVGAAVAPLPTPPVPLGVYAVVPVDQVLAAQFPGVNKNSISLPAANTFLNGFYSGLLNNPAVSGLALQVHWDTLNPNPPTAANPYSWAYVDDAFSSVDSWNLNNPTEVPKTIQLIVTPGFNSPSWLLNELMSCDGLFSSPAVPLAACGKVTFTHLTQTVDGNALPMPWNATYQSAWKTFLTALAARYNGADSTGNPLVSIAVAGPT